jgi:2,4-dienoyl-CoA reductase-like NADH-dependent reductase (Old Yellow Enzyme family)
LDLYSSTALDVRISRLKKEINKERKIIMKTLFDKTVIKKMELKNRIVRSATQEIMAQEDGHLNDRLYELYENLAKGGVGLIITSGAYITGDSKSVPNQIGFYSDEFIEEYKKLTEIIHSYESKVLLQANYASLNGQDLKPGDVSLEDIKSIVAAFGDAAARAEKAGFDGVQIHAAHGFLLSQFLTFDTNRRTDQYGGTLENNSRIIIEIYNAIRERTGKDFLVFLKVNCINANDSERTFESCKYICTKISDCGIDGIEISGKGEVPVFKESIYRDYAAKIANLVNIPIILVEKNRTPDVMMQILDTTRIEYFSLSRPLIRQPDLVKLWMEELNEVPKCVSCGKCMQADGTSCVFNKA